MDNAKKSILFTDKTKSLVKLEIEISHRNGYPEFSISGNYGHSGGQIQYHIKPKNEAQSNLLSLWSKHHLNSMNAGTEKQTELLKSFDGTGFENTCAFLSSVDIDGKDITVKEATETAKKKSKLESKIYLISEDLKHLTGFYEAFKNGFFSKWNIYRNEYLVSIFKGSKGDFQTIEHQGEEVLRFWKQSYGGKIPANQLRLIQDKEKEINTEINKLKEELKKVLLTTAIYDLHPTTGEAYKYGSAWLTVDLPLDIWEQVESICEEIEEAEQEEKNGSPLVADLGEMEEGEDLYDSILGAQEDEGAGALALNLGLNIEELEEIVGARHGYGNCLYEAQGVEYYCGTESEIKEAVKEYVKDTVWAFNPDFLEAQTGIPATAFTSMQKDCEGANDGVLQIIEKTCGLDRFSESAETEDGYAHFLNHYDGEGSEQEYNGTKYFICRT